MTAATKNMMIRVIQRAMEAGQTFDQVIAKYPKLTPAEVQELREFFAVK